MKKVTGIGGVFFKAKDPKAMAEWYQRHLGIEFNGQPYSNFEWANPHHPTKPGSTTFSFFSETTTYLAPSEKPFMINFRVHDLRGLLDTLKQDGVEVVGEMQEFSYGNFGWIMDPEGNKIELWEPKDDGF